MFRFNIFLLLFTVVSDMVSVGEPDLAELGSEPVKADATPLDLSSQDGVSGHILFFFLRGVFYLNFASRQCITKNKTLSSQPRGQ